MNSQKFDLPKMVDAKDLCLADVVRTNTTGAWNTAIVQRLEGKTVTFFRPYGVSEDFSCTSGVICYTGVEIFSDFTDSGSKYLLLRRKELK